MFTEVVEKHGTIDIVINFQGICPSTDFQGRMWDITPESFEAVMQVNLQSVYFLCQCVSEYYIANKICGNILNIASTEGLKGCVVPYGISKAGVVSLTKGFGKIRIIWNSCEWYRSRSNCCRDDENTR